MNVGMLSYTFNSLPRIGVRSIFGCVCSEAPGSSKILTGSNQRSSDKIDPLAPIIRWMNLIPVTHPVLMR